MRLLAAIGMVCLLFGPSASAGSVIRLKARTIQPIPGDSATPLGGHYILQFRTEPAPTMRAELARRGIRVLSYVPDSALLVSSSSEPDLNGFDITWTGRLNASDKLSAELSNSHPAAYLVIFHPDVPPEAARELMRQHGLSLVEHRDLLPGHLLAAGSALRLRDLAARDEVAYILPASPDLAGGQRLHACAGPITQSGPVAPYAQVGPGWPADSGGQIRLRYAFQSLLSQVEESTLRNEVARAFAVWGGSAPLQFTATADAFASRTIGILFARGAHGDDYPFDGPGGMLAHTFFPAPPNPEPIAGDMHLDAGENWHVGANTDLFSVALHEAGHALGLGHSDRPGTVMYPYYHILSGLTQDDIDGIRHLYGSAGPTHPSSGTPPVSPRPPTPPASEPQPPATQPPVAGDHTPPSLRIIWPTSTLVSSYSGRIEIRGVAVDDAGVQRVEWRSSAGDSGVAAGTSQWSAVVPLLVGDNVIIVRAYDAAGNSSWRALTVVRR